MSTHDTMPERHRKLMKIGDAISLLREMYRTTPTNFILDTIDALEKARERQIAANREAEQRDIEAWVRLVSNGGREHYPESVIFFIEDKLREDALDDQLFE